MHLVPEIIGPRSHPALPFPFRAKPSSRTRVSVARAVSRGLTDDQAASRAARELGKLSWRKRKAHEDERNARLAELEAENAELRALLAGKLSNSKSR
jgi:hypothetical protein